MSGKGTQADLLEQKLGFTRIETGKILRKIANSNHPWSTRIADMQKRGVLVSNDIVAEVIKEALQQNAPFGFLLDGTPRDFDQYKVIEEEFKRKNIKIDKVIFINISEQEIIRRISGRRICSRCGNIYNLVTGPVPVDNKCSCGGELKIRNDDTPEATKNRLDYYNNDVMPLIEMFRKEGNLLEINGEQPIEKIHQEIVEKLGL